MAVPHALMLPLVPIPALDKRWGLVKLTREVLIDRTQCIHWCQQVGLLFDGRPCPTCGDPMIMTDSHRQMGRSDTCIGKVYRCQRKTRIRNIRPHDVKITLARGTWFENSNLPMEKILVLTYCAAVGHKVSFINKEIGAVIDDDNTDVSKETIADWLSYFRELCLTSLTALMAGRGPLGGVGQAVEIDEAKIWTSKIPSGEDCGGQVGDRHD
jgi:hypothetical protein